MLTWKSREKAGNLIGHGVILKDRRKFWKTMKNSSKTIIPVPEVVTEFVKIDNTIYGGRLT